MHRLIALDLPGGPAFVAALRRAWDHGDAVLPVDRRLPTTARQALLDLARPHRIITDSDPSGTAFQPDAPLLDDGDALVIASSGTTGSPKLLVHTRSGLSAHATAVHSHLTVDPHRDRWLACLPLAHIGGLGVVLRAILDDVPVDVLPGFDAEVVTTAPEHLGTTLTSLVPTALDRTDSAAYRWVVLGGSGDPAVRAPNVVRTYGLTETGGGIVYDHVPLPGVEVRVDGEGQISVGGPTLARGRRWSDGSITPVTGPDGWLDTGDLGRWSGHGDARRLMVDGRADDLIITGGENVWPRPVEVVLEDHPLVAEAAVFGRVDAEWGSRVVAAVVATDPSIPPTLDQLREHVKDHLPAFSAPRELEVVTSLPRTAIGKLRRGALSSESDG
ncbi:MAG: AMP-binding protein [Aquihabitans sp.]